MTTEVKHHISVCICTFKRPNLLKRLLNALDCQDTEGLFTYSVVVADNDRMQSAEQVAAAFAAASSVAIVYCVEPEQNIALARNKALENTKGDFVAFIDDDEFPTKDWLCNLFKTCEAFKGDGALGPVKPYFEHEPPRWVINGKFFERSAHSTGYKLHWSEMRTGNVLFRKNILGGIDSPFRPEFGTGSEDIDFFGRMVKKGYLFVWCSQAIVYEFVPPSRCRCSYLFRRALLRGSTFPERQTDHVRSLAKSVAAVPLYTMALPILAVSGQHVLIRYLIKLLDHTSRIFAFLGLKLVRSRKT